MKLTAFKTMPDELIRLIMEYARPTYVYMNELKWVISKFDRNPKYLAFMTKWLTRVYGKKYRIYGAKFYEPEFKKMLDMKMTSISDIGYLGREAMEAMEENINDFGTIYEQMLDYIDWYNGELPVY